MVYLGPLRNPDDPDDLSPIGEDKYRDHMWIRGACSCGCSDEKPCRWWRKQLARERVEDERAAQFAALLPEDRAWLAEHVRLVIA